jgi:hypothetical protein
VSPIKNNNKEEMRRGREKEAETMVRNNKTIEND